MFGPALCCLWSLNTHERVMVRLQRIFIVLIFDFLTYHYFYGNTFKQLLTRYKDFQRNNRHQINSFCFLTGNTQQKTEVPESGSKNTHMSSHSINRGVWLLCSSTLIVYIIIIFAALEYRWLVMLWLGFRKYFTTGQHCRPVSTMLTGVCVYTVSEYISMLSGSNTKILLPTRKLWRFCISACYLQYRLRQRVQESVKLPRISW